MPLLNDMQAPVVKICGLTTVSGADAAVNAGADFIGLVFFAKSPRHVTHELASTVAAAVRGKSKIVALTVDAGDDVLDPIVEAVRPDFLQLHGHETPARVAEIKARHGLPIIKALPVASSADVEAADAYRGVADIILFDAKPAAGAEVPGGNGLSFDWRLLDAVAARYPFMLSGGLTPDNVAEAIARTNAHGVDVSSGVESAPGIKDEALIRRFLDAAHTNSDGRA